jgi:RHS repeat-associated protein
MVDEDGTLVNFEEYYPFGETSFGSYGKKRYRFCGKERDEESGLYYYGARYYSPWTCRFVSVDPLAGDYPYLTAYNYAGNKPITHKDIDGLQSTGDTPVSGGGGSAPASGNGQVIPESKKINCHHAQQTKDLLETKEAKTDNLKPNEPVKLSDKEVEAIKDFVNKLSNPTMSLSKEGLEFIKTSEGGFRSTVYDAKTGKNAKFDKEGNITGSGDWTIGYGHKLTPTEIKDKSFSGGVTEKQGEALLLKDVSSSINRINKLSEGSLTQNQFDSLVSFAYQQGNYNKSLDKVMALVNAGKISEAAEQIKNTGNKVHRREAEATMFSKGTYLPPQYYENPTYYQTKFGADYSRLSQQKK